MKFRYKVLLINLIVISIIIGVAEYIMIDRNFELTNEISLQNSIVENNLIQSTVEYELLQLINEKTTDIEDNLDRIGNHVQSNVQVTGSCFYIRYDEKYYYSSDDKSGLIKKTLFDDLLVGNKNYITCKEDSQYYIYVASSNNINSKILNVISKYDVTDAYRQIDEQVYYFRILLIIILAIASVVLFIVCKYLTSPLEKVNKVTDEIIGGHYDTQIEVSTHDEIGLLADKFNIMSISVAKHIDELNEMVRKREQFVADFTHEVKTPMTTIIGYADTLRSMELNREDEIMALNYIFAEGKRLENMSSKLFELIYLNKQDIEMSKCSTVDLQKSVEMTIRPMLTKKNITLKSNLNEAFIYGNKDLLVSALVNILDNARKASDDNSTIDFSGRIIEDDEYSYEIVVRDYGMGMTTEDADKICDEFYMVDKSRSRQEGGAGIGMSLVAVILKKHNAKLQINSGLGDGTTMKILMPKGGCQL